MTHVLSCVCVSVYLCMYVCNVYMYVCLCAPPLPSVKEQNDEYEFTTQCLHTQGAFYINFSNAIIHLMTNLSI